MIVSLLIAIIIAVTIGLSFEWISDTKTPVIIEEEHANGELNFDAELPSPQRNGLSTYIPEKVELN